MFSVLYIKANYRNQAKNSKNKYVNMKVLVHF